MVVIPWSIWSWSWSWSTSIAVVIARLMSIAVVIARLLLLSVAWVLARLRSNYRRLFLVNRRRCRNVESGFDDFGTSRVDAIVSSSWAGRRENKGAKGCFVIVQSVVFGVVIFQSVMYVCGVMYICVVIVDDMVMPTAG